MVYVHDQACTKLMVVGANHVVLRSSVALSQEWSHFFDLVLGIDGNYYITKFKSMLVSR